MQKAAAQAISAQELRHVLTDTYGEPRDANLGGLAAQTAVRGANIVRASKLGPTGECGCD